MTHLEREMNEDFERLWQELDDTADGDMCAELDEELQPVKESIKLIILEIPVSALRG